MSNAKTLADALRPFADLLERDYAPGTSFDVEINAADVAAAKDALTAYDSRTFAADCHELADRCTVILRSNPGLRPSEMPLLRMLVAAAHAVGDNADCAPDLYTEPQP